MKKFALSITSVLTLLVLLVTPSFALAAAQPNYASLSTEKLAYCDINTAPEEWKSSILAARNSIIYSESWTVDGQVAVQLPDGTIEQLPEFSDLFPGWDVPKATAGNEETLEIQEIAPMATNSANYAGYVYLQAPPVGQPSPVFYAFNTSVNRVTMIADSLAGTSFNGGYSDISTGTDVGWANNLPVGSKVYLLNPYSSHSYGARASTNSTPGYALMGVYDDPQ